MILSDKKIKIIGVIAAAVLAIVVVFVYKKDNSKSNIDAGVIESQSNNDNIPKIDSLNIEKPISGSITYSFDGDVFAGLLDYAEKNNIKVEYNNNYDFGVFIESISGIKNGDEGKYWQYYVDDILGDVAADKKNVKNTEKVEWRFESVPF